MLALITMYSAMVVFINNYFSIRNQSQVVILLW